MSLFNTPENFACHVTKIYNYLQNERETYTFSYFRSRFVLITDDNLSCLLISYGNKF